MTETTREAIQAFLPGLGWILYPSDEGFAPGRIEDRHLQVLDTLRVFDHPNENGKKFMYERNEFQKCYLLIGPG